MAGSFIMSCVRRSRNCTHGRGAFGRRPVRASVRGDRLLLRRRRCRRRLLILRRPVQAIRDVRRGRASGRNAERAAARSSCAHRSISARARRPWRSPPRPTIRRRWGCAIRRRSRRPRASARTRRRHLNIKVGVQGRVVLGPAGGPAISRRRCGLRWCRKARAENALDQGLPHPDHHPRRRRRT